MATDSIFLRDFFCFRNLSEDQIEVIAKITDAVCYPPNHLLFKEGETGKRLFLLVRGEVEVLYNIGEEGPAQVDTLSGEEIIGCSALIEPHKYSATERSLTEIEVLEINIPSLLEIMQKDCQLGFKIQQNIIKVLMERIIDLRLAAS